MTTVIHIPGKYHHIIILHLHYCAKTNETQHKIMQNTNTSKYLKNTEKDCYLR